MNKDNKRLIPFSVKNIEHNKWQIEVDDNEPFEVEGDESQIRKAILRTKAKDGDGKKTKRSSKNGTYMNMCDGETHYMWKSKAFHNEDEFKSLMENKVEPISNIIGTMISKYKPQELQNFKQTFKNTSEKSFQKYLDEALGKSNDITSEGQYLKFILQQCNLNFSQLERLSELPKEDVTKQYYGKKVYNLKMMQTGSTMTNQLPTNVRGKGEINNMYESKKMKFIPKELYDKVKDMNEDDMIEFLVQELPEFSEKEILDFIEKNF